jgi:PhzF family phenazine biosynthesis protein
MVAILKVHRIAAFAYNNAGGNPAGVVICEEMPEETEMLRIAKDVGYSETAFLHPICDGWRIRYFAPETEVPFCGHATIATGAELGKRFGEGTYALQLNEDKISVSVTKTGSDVFRSTLQSPDTWSKSAPEEYVRRLLDQFNFSMDDIDKRFPVRIASAGARHLIVVLREHAKLAKMVYAYEPVKELMREKDLTTIDLVFIESDQTIYARNLFPPGGVYEDPATGAAAAALAGYLRDIQWQGKKRFEIFQGQEMGMPSRLLVEYTEVTGEGVKVIGETREILETDG